MSKKNSEALFYSKVVKKAFLAIDEPFRHTRIESHMKAGIPDIAYAFRGHFGWLELKSIPGSVHMNLRHLTGDQKNFFESFGKISPFMLLALEVRYPKGPKYFMFDSARVGRLFEYRNRLTETILNNLALEEPAETPGELYLQFVKYL